jgi:hypothetical protein
MTFWMFGITLHKLGRKLKLTSTMYGIVKTACREIAQNVISEKNFDKIDCNLLGCRVGKHIISLSTDTE